MKKLNDLKCSGCGTVEKDVFTEIIDGKVVVRGRAGEDVVALCKQCGSELRTALVRFGIGSNRGDAPTEKAIKPPEAADFVGMSFPVRHPITGDPAVVRIDNLGLTTEVGGVKCFDGKGSIHTVIPPERLN